MNLLRRFITFNHTVRRYDPGPMEAEIEASPRTNADPKMPTGENESFRLFEEYTNLRKGLSLKADYIVENFLERGEQALLYGQPKVGKTFLAIQLAVAVAHGRKFLNWDVKVPRKVLYLNFEMGHRVFARRIADHFPLEEKSRKHKSETEDDQIARQAEAVEEALKENFVFTVSPRSINILDESHSRQLKELIARHQPALIIFDTFVKVHQVDERANEKIGQVLIAIRNACVIDRKPIAHIIVHHARKASMNMDDRAANLTAHEIRGASAIRGEADLIIGLSKNTGGAGGGAFHSLILEARNIAFEDIDIEFREGRHFEVSDRQTRKAVEELLEGKIRASKEPLHKEKVYEEIAKELSYQVDTVRRCGSQWLSKQSKWLDGNATLPDAKERGYDRRHKFIVVKEPSSAEKG